MKEATLLCLCENPDLSARGSPAETKGFFFRDRCYEVYFIYFSLTAATDSICSRLSGFDLDQFPLPRVTFSGITRDASYRAAAAVDPVPFGAIRGSNSSVSVS